MKDFRSFTNFSYSVVGFSSDNDNDCSYNYSAKFSCVIWSLSHLRGLLLPSIYLTFSSSVCMFLFRKTLRLNYLSSKDGFFVAYVFMVITQVLTKHLIYIVSSSVNNAGELISRTCHTFTKLSLSPWLNSFCLFLSLPWQSNSFLSQRTYP